MTTQPTRPPENIPAAEHDALLERALRTTGEQRQTARLTGRDGLSETTLALAFVVAVTTLGILEGAKLDIALAGFYVAVYAAVSLTRFEIGAGYTMPTVLVLVPMLFVLPAAWVPALVGIGLCVGQIPSVLAGRAAPARAVVSALGNAWHAVPPALIFTGAGIAGAPDVGHWPVYLAAFAAQLAWDVLLSLVRERDVPTLLLMRHMREVVISDTLLIPLGLLAAVAVADAPAAIVLVLPLCLLLSGFARERRHRVAVALQAEAQSTRRRVLSERIAVAAGLHETVAQALGEGLMWLGLARDEPDDESLERAEAALLGAQGSMQTTIRSLREGADSPMGVAAVLNELATPLLGYSKVQVSITVGEIPPGDLRAGVSTLLASAVDLVVRRLAGSSSSMYLQLEIDHERAVLKMRAPGVDDRSMVDLGSDLASLGDLAKGLGASVDTPSPTADGFDVTVPRPFGEGNS